MIHTTDNLLSSDEITDHTSSRQLVFYKALIILTAGIYVWLRAWNLAAYSLWGGETFILDGIHQTWTGMFAYIIRDIVHPPLFYILVKVWISLFGESLTWMKLIPFLASILTIIPFLMLCRELNLKIQEMSLAFILIAINGFLIHYAQEVRMYSLFACLSVFSLWLFVRYWKSESDQRKALFWLFLANLLMVYTHYYGWLVIGMEFIYLAFWKRTKLFAFSLSLILLLLFFLPWTYLVLQSAIDKGGLESNVDWIPRPTLSRLTSFYSNLNGQLPFPGSKALGLILFSIPIILWGWYVVWKEHDREGSTIFWWLTLLVSLPVLFLFLISRVFSLSFWVDRYFIFVAIPYLLLVCIAVSRIPSKRIRIILTLFLMGWSLFAGASDQISNRIAWESPQVGSRIHWESITRQISQEETNTGEEIPIYALTVMSNNARTGDWAIMTSLQFYLDKLNDDRFELIYARDVSSLLPVAGDYFWVGSFVLDAEKPNGLPDNFRKNGFQVGEVIQERKGDNWLIFFPVWRH